MANIRRRLASLEGQVSGIQFAPGWSQEEIEEKVLDEIDFALSTRSPVSLCNDELEALDVGTVSDLPEWLQPHVDLRPPTWGTIRHRYKYPPEHPFESWRERVRKRQEGSEEHRKQSKQRDRNLLEENRAACGIAPLTPEEVRRYELEGTVWGGGSTY